jgi:AraC-like DNA-binding protein
VSGSKLVVTRHESEASTWLMARRNACPRLRTHVLGYLGFAESAPNPVGRCCVPRTSIRLFINLGQPMQVRHGPAPKGIVGRVTSFVSGIGDKLLVHEHRGRQQGIAVYLTPRGASALFGIPPGELTNVVVELSELLGTRADRLVSQLAEIPDWDARLALLDRVLERWMTHSATLSEPVLSAWLQLCESEGQVRIGEVAEQIGWSRKHLVVKFHKELGLSPKQVGRVLRFERAVHLLRRSCRPRLTDIAASCGFSDQAHFAREFRALAGCTATQYLSAQLPNGGGTGSACC